jgi:RHS (Retrotransposon Hot Spot) family protein
MLNSHETMMKLEDAYEKLLQQGFFLAPDGNEVNKVQNLGHGVFVQHFTRGIVDNSSKANPKVITRRESRDVARAAVASLFEPWDEEMNRAAIVGNPGIGKSRGTMMHTLQLLLVVGATVVLLAYDQKIAYLFVPNPNGNWTVKFVHSDDLVVKYVLQIPDVVCLIDPPEDTPFEKQMMCNMILFSFFSDEKLHNFNKKGHFIYTSTCSIQELFAMIPILWNKDSPVPRQNETSLFVPIQLPSIEEIQNEVFKRALLVGGAPRYVFNYSKFRDRCSDINGGITKKTSVEGSLSSITRSNCIKINPNWKYRSEWKTVLSSIFGLSRSRSHVNNR